MKMPIIEGLQNYINEKNIRFHMPGHKGKNTLIDWGSLIPEIDVTEIEGTDNLHNPTSIIKESQELAAKVFGAKKTFYSINGTTGGIYSAIMACTKPGDKILIQRNSHKSVYNAAMLGKLHPVYIYPKYSQRNKMVTYIDPNEVEEILVNDSDIKAVVITYPSYYGICSDIRKISETVHKYNKILIVDEAHGSHFVFSDKLPLPALKAGADIVIQSAHKTLPAFTQSSMVHVGTDRIDIERLKTMLSIHQTTSPSYILMGSLDLARAYMEDVGKEKLNLLLNNIKRYTKYLKEIKGVRVFDKDNTEEDYFYDFDITKIVISLMDLNITGKELDKILRYKYKIQLEMADYYYGVALVTVLNESNDIEKLVYAVEDISKNTTFYGQSKLSDIPVKYMNPHINLSLHEAFYKEKSIISLKDSVGMVAGGFLIPYPPGIPVLCPGEIITEETVEYINVLKKNNIEILGFVDYNEEQIRVVK